jgi:glycosyltransferase involved in cell wall biosynthesis
MKKLPFVSVIVPTYQEEKYIENCLRALRNQDYKGKYEIIVADSMSKDKTVKIAKKHADKVILVKKKGPSAGRNAGAREAKGEILLFVDADTMLLPNVITEVVKCLRKRGVIGVSIPLITDDLKKNIYYFTSLGLYYLLTKVNLQPVYAVCFACKKESFIKAGGFDEKLYVAEDVEFGQRLKKIGKIYYLTNTFAITSARRLKKWNVLKIVKAWPLGYLYFRFLKKQPKYPAIR